MLKFTFRWSFIEKAFQAMICMVNRTATSELEARQEIPSKNGSSPSSSPSHFLPFSTSKNASGACYNSTFLHSIPNARREYVIIGSVLLRISQLIILSIFENGELIIPKSQQSLIFASFYLGGLIITLPGSYLCDYFG